MNDINTVSNKLNFSLYIGDTTLSANNDISHVSSQISFELQDSSDWLTVNKLSLKVEKTKYMIFQNYQRVTANEDIRDLQINYKNIERVSCSILWA